LAAWVNIDSLPVSFAWLIHKGPASVAAPPEYDISFVPSSGSAQIAFRVGDGTGNSGAATAVVSINAWHHIVGVHDAALQFLAIYVDGALAASGSYTFGSYAGSDSFVIGAHTGGTFSMDGRVQGVGLWKRALEPIEVISLYNGGSALLPPF
jgi:hypothetical protein